MFFFFVVAPFCSCPASLVSRKFFAVGPGCAKCFFLLRSVGRRDLSAGPEQKKNTTQGVFFAPAPGKGQGKEKPRWAPARGQSKKNTTQGVCFLLRPRRKASEGEAPLGAGTGPEHKKKHHPGCFFFAPAPGKGRGRRSPVGRRHGARAKNVFFCSGPVPAPNGASPSPAFPRGRSKKKKHPGWCFFFLLWPRAGAQRGFSFACLSPGPQQKKKHPRWCFFFCSGPVPAPNGASPSLAFRRGRSKQNNTLGGVFFLLRPRADAHSLTAGLGGDASPSPGWCFFFCCGPARTGVVFFFFAVAPPGRSLTHGGLGRFRQGPGGVFFFCCGPAGSF